MGSSSALTAEQRLRATTTLSLQPRWLRLAISRLPTLFDQSEFGRRRCIRSQPGCHCLDAECSQALTSRSLAWHRPSFTTDQTIS